MKKLTETFNSISLSKGETFEIELDAVPGAGYGWQVSITSGQAKKLKDEFSIPAGNLCGGSSTQHIIFKAEETGEIEIRADYKRPWEKKIEKSATFKISVS